MDLNTSSIIKDLLAVAFFRPLPSAMAANGIAAEAVSPYPANLEDLPDLYGWPRENDRGYRIQERPSGSLRPLRVVVLGAGASGISFAKFAQDQLENVDFVLYEKNYDVGGTWLENRYPYVTCGCIAFRSNALL